MLSSSIKFVCEWAGCHDIDFISTGGKCLDSCSLEFVENYICILLVTFCFVPFLQSAIITERVHGEIDGKITQKRVACAFIARRIVIFRLPLEKTAGKTPGQDDSNGF